MFLWYETLSYLCFLGDWKWYSIWHQLLCSKATLLKCVLCVFYSGYDFGYLIKILSNANLPEEEVDFFEILRLYFPVIYDVKYLMKSCKNLKVLL